MPDEPLNNNQESPDNNVMGDSQVNNTEPQPMESTDIPPEVIADTPVETADEPKLEGEAFAANPVVDETPISQNDETQSADISTEINSEFVSAEPEVSQPEASSDSSAPFVAPESLPVQSTGSEPALPPKPEQPKKNNLVLWLALAIIFVALAVAGYFLAKYLF